MGKKRFRGPRTGVTEDARIKIYEELQNFRASKDDGMYRATFVLVICTWFAMIMIKLGGLMQLLILVSSCVN